MTLFRGGEQVAGWVATGDCSKVCDRVGQEGTECSRRHHGFDYVGRGFRVQAVVVVDVLGHVGVGKLFGRSALLLKHGEASSGRQR